MASVTYHSVFVNIIGNPSCICLFQVPLWCCCCSPHPTIRQSHTVGHRGSSWAPWRLLAFLFYNVYYCVDFQVRCYCSNYNSYNPLPHSSCLCARACKSDNTREFFAFLKNNTDYVSNNFKFQTTIFENVD